MRAAVHLRSVALRFLLSVYREANTCAQHAAAGRPPAQVRADTVKRTAAPAAGGATMRAARGAAHLGLLEPTAMPHTLTASSMLLFCSLRSSEMPSSRLHQYHSRRIRV
jgi:hypothetical protein